MTRRRPPSTPTELYVAAREAGPTPGCDQCFRIAKYNMPGVCIKCINRAANTVALVEVFPMSRCEKVPFPIRRVALRGLVLLAYALGAVMMAYALCGCLEVPAPPAPAAPEPLAPAPLLRFSPSWSELAADGAEAVCMTRAGWERMSSDVDATRAWVGRASDELDLVRPATSPPPEAP